MRSHVLLAELGRRLRAARDARGLSLGEAAAHASLSPRYLRMAEAGDANLSVLKLAALARTLRVPLRELCDLDLTSAPVLRLALLGLRGAGKSTVGRDLAQELEVPFQELDALVEDLAGLPLEQLFAIHGEEHYRRLQREALEAWLSQTGSGVLAAGGSLVTDPEAYQRLRETCRTVWLRTTPEEHWRRVVEQGDLRPMRGHPRAMSELRGLLAAREPHYARADLALDTTGRDPHDIAARIARWAMG